MPEKLSREVDFTHRYPSNRPTLKLGVAGYSGQKFDQKKAVRLLISGIDRFLKDNDLPKEEKIAIVSGYTDLGIPGLAYRIGKRRGYHLVGLSAQATLQYKLYPVDEKIIKGTEFGDESKFFLSYIDGLLKVGGGKQSAEEFAGFRKKYPKKWAWEYRLEASSS